MSHSADVRPTRTESVPALPEPAMFRLYNLIWQRFVASQMEAAVYDTLQVDVVGDGDGRSIC
jgi:DNA topoisomerase-1